MPQKELRIIIKAFLSSQFAYCPLIWMFHRRQINHKINKFHERALRISWSFSSFEELISKDESVTVHEINLQILATEMYKIIKDYPQILCKTFLKLEVATVILVICQHFLQEILQQLDVDYRPSRTWDLVPKEMKQVTTLNEFKAIIKIWELENCLCQPCRT